MILDFIALSDFAIADEQPWPVFPIQYGVRPIIRAAVARRSYRAIQVAA